MNAKWVTIALCIAVCFCASLASAEYGDDCGETEKITVFPNQAMKLCASPNHAPTWEYAWSAYGPDTNTPYAIAYGGTALDTAALAAPCITFNAPSAVGYYKFSVTVGPNYANCKQTKCYQVHVVAPQCPTPISKCENDYPYTDDGTTITGPTFTRVAQGYDDSLVTYHWYLDPTGGVPAVGATYSAPTGSTASGTGISFLVPWTTMPITDPADLTQVHHLYLIVEDKTGSPGVVRQVCDITITIYNQPTTTDITASAP